MKKLAEEIGNCITCQSLTPPKPPQPAVSRKMPEKVWKAINMDYLGLLPNEKSCLVLIDQRSRYKIVAFTTSTNATSLIKILENLFQQHGLPDRIYFKNYFETNRIYHQKITPRWHRANGEVEKFM